MEKSRKKRIILGVGLVLFNVIMIVVAVASSAIFSVRVRTERENANTASFVSTIESMKDVSQTYLDSERGYVKNWAAYISGHEMTLAQAMEFLRTINTDAQRYVHVVDMASFRAYSTFYAPGREEIDTYLEISRGTSDHEVDMVHTMFSFFGGEEDFNVMGMYRTRETRSDAVSVGTPVTLQTPHGPQNYLLLRVIPVAELKNVWIFPVEYPSAEVGIISRSGDYVIQSISMKSDSFAEYIRTYNFQDDYSQKYTLVTEIREHDAGILHYKDFRGEDCLWYYSSFGDRSNLRILGMVAEDDLKTSADYWRIVLMISGTLVVLMAVDGLYLYVVNRRLKRAAQLAEQASLAKTQFLSAMSHDIRTPMNIVQGMTGLALHNMDNPAYAAQCLEKSMKAGRQLLTLINNVLDISKIESGKLVLNPADFSLEEMVSGVVEVLKPAMEEKEIHFTLETGSLPYDFLHTDQMRLSQVYSNLLSNALKYTNPGGNISMELHEQVLLQQPGQVRLVCCIRDSGIGMSPEYQRVMYDSFSRAVDTQVNRTQGTGLGLSIVKQVVDALGGSIQCKSTPGIGTAFTVSVDVPYVEQQSGEVTIEDDSLQQLRGMKLLAAEDNELNQEILGAVLEEYGVVCHWVTNGRECVEQLVAAPAGSFEGILMDVHMPVMDGLEAAQAIRSLPDRAYCQIPIIAMTADAFAEDVQKCLRCGMNGHVAKPIEVSQLLEYLLKIKGHEL